MDLIRIKDVKKQYKNGVTAIYDLNLSVKKAILPLSSVVPAAEKVR